MFNAVEMSFTAFDFRSVGVCRAGFAGVALLFVMFFAFISRSSWTGDCSFRIRFRPREAGRVLSGANDFGVNGLKSETFSLRSDGASHICVIENLGEERADHAQY